MTVLALIALLTAAAGVVLLVETVHYRLVRREAQEAGARYLAEAGLYLALDSVRQDPAFAPDAWRVAVGPGDTAVVTVRPFGGYLWVVSHARRGRVRFWIRALAGETAAPSMQHAVYMWDPDAPLTVAGTTRVAGPVLVSEHGVKEGAFRGEAFGGEVTGPVYATPELTAPFFDPTRLDAFPALADMLLLAAAAGDVDSEMARAYRPARHLPEGNALRLRVGDAWLTPADSLLLDRPITVAATGDLHLQGPLRFASGSVFVAGEALLLEGEIRGGGGLFYGRAFVDVRAGVRCAGQFFSRAGMRVAGGAYLGHPSLIYLTGQAAAAGGHVAVEDGAVVDGAVVHPAVAPPPDTPAGRIVIHPGARVRGVVYNGMETELAGTVYGAVLTRQFYFYDSPTSYVDWIRDAAVDLDERPVPVVLPPVFSGYPALVALQGAVEAEHLPEPEASP